MNYNKIEELYVDFILDLIGPNTETENDRNTKLKLIKTIITNIFKQKYWILQHMYINIVHFQ